MRKVVHVAGHLTDAVFRFLGPATAALADHGVDQTVVLLDDQHGRPLFEHFHPLVDLIPVDVTGGPIARWTRLLTVFRQTLEDGPVFAVHLHGLLPFALGSFASRGFGGTPVLFLSPHGSKALRALSWRDGTLLRMLRPFVDAERLQALTSARYEAQILAHIGTGPVEVLESPIPTRLLDLTRTESVLPRVATASGAAVTARLAVLLAHDECRVLFDWFGPVDDAARERLSAAGVNFCGPLDATERLRRLSSAWVYVAANRNHGFAHRLAEAMALGLPCVAIDSVASRDLLRDGETGFLCKTTEDALFHVARLIDSPDLRARMGDAARTEARLRFRSERFNENLLDLYRINPPAKTGFVSSDLVYR